MSDNPAHRAVAVADAVPEARLREALTLALATLIGVRDALEIGGWTNVAGVIDRHIADVAGLGG